MTAQTTAATAGPTTYNVTAKRWKHGWELHIDGVGSREMMMFVVVIRPVEDLADIADPGWPRWLELAAAAAVPVVVLPGSGDAGREVLFRLQVTARSMLGAVALNSGGLLIDHGWIRVLGGGSDLLPDLATVNGLGKPAPGAAPPPALTVAFDVLGGRFAVNGGGLPGQPGEVCYWGPDTLAWTELGAGYSQFARALLTGGMADFYQDLRWPGWQDEVTAVGADQGIAVYPFLFTAEGRSLARASRRPVPFTDLLALHADLERQASQLPPGSKIRIAIADGTDG